MASQKKGSSKLWKPPSFEDFNVETQCKRIKLDNVEEALEEIRESEVQTFGEPRTVDELATHPKKIEELRSWLERSVTLKGPMLLITGPSGSAKTVTLKVVASSLGVTVREWVNPMDKTDFKNESVAFDRCDFVEGRQIDRFEDFTFRASRYRSLFDDSGKSVILVEDFPNIFVWKPKSFYEFLEKYQANGKSPIVFICTDDQNLNLSHELFPNSIKSKFGIAEIKFNPVNQSSLMRTLKAAVRNCPDKSSLSADVLQSIAQGSNGDLRNALGNLQVLMTTSKAGKKKKATAAGTRGRTKTQSQGQSQSGVVSVKDNRTEFYQALGRVLYPKTIKKMGKGGAGNIENENRIFVHDVTEMSDAFTDSFLVLLHENYVNTFSDLTSVTEAASIFSVCDVMRGVDELREYASLITVIGLMVSNKEPKREGFKPIKKSSAPSVAGNDVWSKRFEYSNYNATCRTLDLDIIPYLKKFGDLRISSANGGGEMGVVGEGEMDGNFVIEEFDD